MFEKARSLIARALRAVLGPVQERMLQRVLDLIGPAVQGAVARAQMMFPNGLPTPAEIPPAVQQAASQVPAAGPGVMDALMKPEGDHIGFGINLSASAAEGVGVQPSIAAMFDIVFDYRRNDIGFFVTPGGNLQVNALEGSLTAGVGYQAAWGTVASFGDPNNDVLASYGGWAGSVSYGVQGKLAIEGGVQVQTGGTFYRSGSFELGGPSFSYTPIGADEHTIPGTPGGRERPAHRARRGRRKSAASSASATSRSRRRATTRAPVRARSTPRRPRPTPSRPRIRRGAR